MNLLTHAVAGSRKTQSIVDQCSHEAASNEALKTLVLTYTLTAQADVDRRLRAACAGGSPTVMGWYSFLLHHWVKPYLPCKFPGRHVTGLNFDGPHLASTKNSRGKWSNVDFRKGEQRYFDKESRVYRRYLSKVALEVLDSSGGAVLDRLERIYSIIYIDEVQDLTGYDLEILERLLRSRISIRLVGDVRQSLYDTNPQDPKHKPYHGLKMGSWFRLQEQAGRLSITESNVTWRSNQEIATFSDRIFDSSLSFGRTESKQELRSNHDGVFGVTPDQVQAYLSNYNPTCLRRSRQTPVPSGVDATNFGLCKGLTRERVLIFPTSTIVAYLTGKSMLKDGSACGLYVAVTRAIYSVAFVVDDPARCKLRVWSP